MARVAPDLTVVIPVYNEEEVLPALFARLYPALDALARSYEVVFVNDGSRDRSAALLRQQFELRPDVTRVVLFSSNFGQHRAILAGFAHSRGRYRHHARRRPAESAGGNRPRCSSELDAGHDYVGTIRIERQDLAWRRYASRLMNRHPRAHHAGQDHRPGLHVPRLRPHRGRRGQSMLASINTFVPALAYTFSMNPTEIDVAHEERGAGKSKYSLFSLMRLNFDLMTGFSTAPMQLFSVIGIVIALLSVAVRAVPVGAPLHGRARRPKACSRCLRSRSSCSAWRCSASDCSASTSAVSTSEVRHRPRYIVGTVLERDEDSREPRGRGHDAATTRSAWCSPITMSACAACERCWRTASSVPLVVTHVDAPAENIWFDSVERHALWHGIQVLTPENPNVARTHRRVCGAARPNSCSRSITDRCSAASCWRCRRAAPTTCTARCCPNIAAAPRSTGRCCTASTETGATLHAMVAKPDAGESSRRGGADPAG